jgi:hypothetical protein
MEKCPIGIIGGKASCFQPFCFQRRHFSYGCCDIWHHHHHHHCTRRQAAEASLAREGPGIVWMQATETGHLVHAGAAAGAAR